MTCTVYGIRGFKLATMSSGRRAEAGSSRGESTKPAMRAVVQSRSPWVALFGSRKVPEADESVACLPAAALNQEQVNMATKMEELALAAVVDPPVRARAPEQVRGTIEPLLVQFTQSFSGVPDAIGLASQLKLNVSKSDPGVYASWPRGAKSAFKSGGPCPTHQDYSPSRETDGERSYTFIMLLQDTAASNGATYVYPGSRLLQQRMEPISLPKPAHRPSKKRKRKAVQPGDLNPHVLDQDLTKLCGAPQVLAGAKYTIFRFESALWHGALPNTSTRPRHVLIWSYATSKLARQFQLTR